MECKCETCVRKDCAERTKQDDLRIVIQCDDYVAKKQTNGDCIRAMSNEELANFIPNWSYTNACKCDEKPYVDCNNECEKCVLEWLQQPLEGV